MNFLLEPPQYGLGTDAEVTVPRTPWIPPTNTDIPSSIPVARGPRGLSYDVDKVADEALRKRILANRASAKSSRQQRLDKARAMQDNLARFENENSALREANTELQQQITEAHADLASFESLFLHAKSSFAGKPGVFPLNGSNAGFGGAAFHRRSGSPSLAAPGALALSQATLEHTPSRRIRR
jgi:hypothetical protein